ncbi:hypothetical protein SprV_0702253800 [Sparganum proliferum]
MFSLSHLHKVHLRCKKLCDGKMSRLLENPLSNVRALNDCRGRQYNVLLSAVGVESVAFRNAGCGDAEQEEEAVEFGGGIESGLVRQDETEQSGQNNTMQYPKPQLRKLKFVPELEGIEEVSEEEEEEEEEEKEEEDCEEEDGEDDSTNDNNGVKPEVKEGCQQQNVHAGGDADCLAVVSEVNIANCEACAVVAARDREVIQMRMPVLSAGGRRPPRWSHTTRQPGKVSPLTLAAWNFRSLLDSRMSNRPDRMTTSVAWYKMDIGEIWFSKQGQVDEVGDGYTFFAVVLPMQRDGTRMSPFPFWNNILQQ